jgi:pimeloyl-ACP methyl ester carboxylesterase
MSNGYPQSYLVAYEHPTGPGAPAPEDQIDGLDAMIDAVLDETGVDRVDVIAHSRGGGVCFHYLESSAERAAKVAHYVVVDSQTGLDLTMGMDRTIRMSGGVFCIRRRSAAEVSPVRRKVSICGSGSNPSLSAA